MQIEDANRAMNDLEGRWMEAAHAADAARAELAACANGGLPNELYLMALARLHETERQKSELMKRIEDIEDSLLES
jgi:hypothetical protein